MSTYDDTVKEVADDLGMEEEALRKAFTTFVNTIGASMATPGITDYERAACYAVYRLTKSKSAFKMQGKSRERWKERAMELGSPPHLVKS